MKKALQISIAQTLFTIEEDAYAKLDHYLAGIRAHFSSTEGREEIIGDIESRIGEKLSESKKEIITLQEVENVMASIGRVEDFDGDQNEKVTTDKKLFRDPDNKIIAGVCSGLGKYFGIDPLWVRIAFVVTGFMSGFGVLLYVILALTIPEAKNASQKLEMEGSPVTLETIRDNFKEQVADIKTRHGRTLKEVLALPFRLLKKLIDFIARAILPLLRICIGGALSFISGALILGLTFIAPFILSMPAHQFAEFPVREIFGTPLMYATILSVYVALVIPVVFIFLFAISLLRRKAAMKSALGFSLLGIWFVSLIASGIFLSQSVFAYRDYVKTSPDYETITQTVPLEGAITDLLISSGRQVVLVQGDTPSLVMAGQRKDIEATEITNSDGTLSIKNIRESCFLCSFETPKITLTLPTLANISITEGSHLVSDAWQADASFAINAANGSWGELRNIDTHEIQASAKNGSHLKLSGTATKATFDAQGGSDIAAGELQVQDATATATHGAFITAHATATLNAHAANGGLIRYNQEPNLVVREEESFGGSIREREQY